MTFARDAQELQPLPVQGEQTALSAPFLLYLTYTHAATPASYSDAALLLGKSRRLNGTDVLSATIWLAQNASHHSQL